MNKSGVRAMNIIETFKNKKSPCFRIGEEITERIYHAFTLESPRSYRNGEWWKSLWKSRWKKESKSKRLHPLELLDFAVMVKNPGIPYTNTWSNGPLGNRASLFDWGWIGLPHFKRSHRHHWDQMGKTTTTYMIGEVLTAAGQNGFCLGVLLS